MRFSSCPDCHSQKTQRHGCDGKVFRVLADTEFESVFECKMCGAVFGEFANYELTLNYVSEKIEDSKKRVENLRCRMYDFYYMSGEIQKRRKGRFRHYTKQIIGEEEISVC